MPRCFIATHAREGNLLLRDALEDVSRHGTAHQRLPEDQVRMVLEIGELPRLERLDSDVTFLREIKRLVFRGEGVCRGIARLDRSDAAGRPRPDP